MKPKIHIKKWIIFTRFVKNKDDLINKNLPSYELDATNLDVTEEELCWNIQEQLFGGEND